MEKLLALAEAAASPGPSARNARALIHSATALAIGTACTPEAVAVAEAVTKALAGTFSVMEEALEHPEGSAEVTKVGVVLGVVAVRNGGSVIRSPIVEVDGLDFSRNRVKTIGPRRAWTSGNHQRRKGERERYPSPISETHGHSLYIVRFFPPGVSGIEREAAVLRAFLRAEHADISRPPRNGTIP